MSLHKEITLPNGAVGTYHQLIKIETNSDMTKLDVRVGSWPTFGTYIEGRAPIWSHYLELPIGDLYDATQLAVKSMDPFTGSLINLDLTSMDLMHLKAKKWFEIKTDRDKLEFGGFTWSTHVFDSDSVSQGRIQGGVQLALIANSNNTAFTIDWTLQDNSVITLSASDMIAVGVALAQHVETVHGIARNLREQIESCMTTEELAAIAWPTT